ncbi:MAG: DUF1350 family protein [Leptolyngbyaceae bacterium]|nr:DUF1350 family protein [Leptolyngbyaceae bacterium]
MDWQEIAGNWVLIPRRPRAIIHFLGGAFIAAAPHVTYRWLLENLAQQGYLVIATSLVNTFDHGAIARQALLSFEQAMECIHDRVGQGYLPIYGVGHSMGCKIHLLICSLFEEERAGNIFISFNNYPARRSVPLLDQFSQLSTVFDGARRSLPFLEQMTPLVQNTAIEFTPSPEETLELIASSYGIRRNLLIKFMRDDIDQTYSLHDVLFERFPKMTAIQILRGNHLTPVGQDIQWQSGQNFSPLDAVGQFMKQELYRDLKQLRRHILTWLDPVGLESNQLLS